MLRFLAWAALVAILFLTVSPLRDRPETIAGSPVERAGAYVVLGLLFGLAFPQHRRIALPSLLLFAGLLEVAQLLTPDRHARVVDALTKMLGAGLGISIAIFISRTRTLRGPES